MKVENIPENNLVVLLLLTILSGGIYLFWWIARVSKIFKDNPVTNILLIVIPALVSISVYAFLDILNIFYVIAISGIWYFYLNIKYLQKSEQLNGRDMPWFMVIFLPISFLLIQHNINEKYYPGK